MFAWLSAPAALTNGSTVTQQGTERTHPEAALLSVGEVPYFSAVFMWILPCAPWGEVAGALFIYLV
jgi:hypothetical protein